MSRFRDVSDLPFLLPCVTSGFQAIEVAQIMDEALDANKIEVVLRCIKISESRVSTDFPDWYSTSESVSSIRHLFTASWVYSKVVTVGISFLEQERRYRILRFISKLLNLGQTDTSKPIWHVLNMYDSEVFKNHRKKKKCFGACIVWLVLLESSLGTANIHQSGCRVTINQWRLSSLISLLFQLLDKDSLPKYSLLPMKKWMMVF